jgi:hypothetical protein
MNAEPRLEHRPGWFVVGFLFGLPIGVTAALFAFVMYLLTFGHWF